VFADSTSVNLYKLAMAALAARPGRRTIVSDTLNFPSDLYILQGAARQTGARLELFPGAADGLHGDEDAVIAALDDDTALLVLSHVTFKSGFMYDAARLTAAAHERGALVLWDLSHSVGAVPVELDAWGADLAIGCGYKYLNGGPGAPAFLYVRRDLQDALVSPIWGWFGQERPFAFDLEYAPVAGIRRFTVGTPPTLSLLGVEGGVRMIAEAGMARVREASVALTAYLIELVDARLAPLGFRVGTPRDAARRGSHVSIAHDDAYRITRAMVDAGVIPDFREPDGIRVGVAPLYVGYEDLWMAVERMAAIVERREHERYDAARAVVT
jgi:kynureninase